MAHQKKESYKAFHIKNQKNKTRNNKQKAKRM